MATGGQHREVKQGIILCQRVGGWCHSSVFLVVLHIFMLWVVFFFFPCTVLRTLGWSTDDYVDIDGQCISKIGDEAGLANAIWRDKASMRSVPIN